MIAPHSAQDPQRLVDLDSRVAVVLEAAPDVADALKAWAVTPYEAEPM